MAQNYKDMDEIELWEEIQKRFADPLKPRDRQERRDIAAGLFNDKEKLREALEADDGLLMEFCKKNGEAAY